MQEIIVYRNPVEAAIWNSASGAEFVPIFSGIIMFFVVFLTMNYISDKLVYRWFYWKRDSFVFKHRQKFPNISLFVGAAVGIFTCWKMWI